MRIRRLLRAVSKFLTQLGAAMLRAVVTSLVLGVLVVSLMHYMGVPVPSAHDLLGGLTKLAEILS
jgi:phosphate/sulfate permease